MPVVFRDNLLPQLVPFLGLGEKLYRGLRASDAVNAPFLALGVPC